VTGLTRAKAIAALEDADLKLGRETTRYDDQVDKGRVISSSPGAGKATTAGSAIALTVSKGPQPVDVPNVVNQWIPDAKQILAQAGFTVETTDELNPDVPKGMVFAQDPSGGGQAPKGSTIRLKVSIGSEALVPDVTGRSYEEAKQILEQLGYQVQRKDIFGGFLDQVQRQDPQPGTPAPPGTTVTLRVI
jgi:serine/threonine-protein kinase